jgi:hypothetical protein
MNEVDVSDAEYVLDNPEILRKEAGRQMALRLLRVLLEENRFLFEQLREARRRPDGQIPPWTKEQSKR